MLSAKTALYVALASIPLFGHVHALGDDKIVAFPSLSQLSGEYYSWLGPTDYSKHQEQTTFIASNDRLNQASSVHGADNYFVLASSHHRFASPLLLSSEDDQSIHVAAQTFAEDVYKITGHRPDLYNDTLPDDVHRAVIVGSVESGVIRSLKTDPKRESLKGKWESFDISCEASPLEGLEEALVITGSDRRGTIYALYTLSEQMGISPFYFWSDVPIPHHSTLAILKNKSLSHGEPTVKYRGLFINDEHPALWGWAAQRWNRDPWEPAFQVEMYELWFEMMLRLKANYFWPAMWASKFSVDGLDITNGLPQPAIPGPNQVLANKMGIVMGTSHHEPMSRNKPEWDIFGNGPWDWTNKDVLKDFWRYGAERAKGIETLFTMGMRGDGDEPLTDASNELVQNITKVQQDILKDVYDTDDLVGSGVSQMWCMYKEVAGYYQNGLEVPDDGMFLLRHPVQRYLKNSQCFIVTVLFADDNYGNIMSVLPPERQGHEAGAGIYYHVDSWDQMNIARSFNTTQIWILNIGTLKPLEMPTEWFLDLAWDFDRWERNSWKRWLREWAAREFGEEWKEEIGDIMGKYSAKTAANVFAHEAIEAFYQDANITETFHSLLNRKWDQTDTPLSIWDQTHINYYTNLEPIRDSLPPIHFVNPFQPSRPGIPLREGDLPGQVAYVRLTVENSLGAWPGDNVRNCERGYKCPDPILLPMDPWGEQSRWIDIGAGGPKNVSWKMEVDVDWLTVEPRKGKTVWDGSGDERIWVSMDWDKVPVTTKGETVKKEGHIEFSAADRTNVTVTVPIIIPPSPPSSFRGHVEGDEYVAIEAAHYTTNTSAEGYAFEELEGYGRTLSGLEMFPVNTQNFTLGEGPKLEYDFWAHGDSMDGKGKVEITVQVGPTLNFLVGKELAFGLQFDNLPPKEIHPVPTKGLGESGSDRKPGEVGSVPEDWMEVVSSEIRNVTMEVTKDGWEAGKHTVTIWGMTTGVVVERIWVDMGGIRKRGEVYDRNAVMERGEMIKFCA
ncbi:hypothetical protein I306_01818 [Cryptococcus gattii EJB2]|uniref:Gylcosyl hydrolase 115 C-terminal domain-containing protein n=1 Tax=Cryptococcus gattii EJB2 TaxID=1296103 RepID=A0ABR5BZN1_9TREE|nr:hypothetical protein I306_01818 [Cryptococcus gattii EJB2]